MRRTTALDASHGGSVALTQPAGATVCGSGLVQPCDGEVTLGDGGGGLEERRLPRLQLAVNVQLPSVFVFTVATFGSVAAEWRGTR